MLLVYGYVFMVGACVGSFVLLAAERIPKGENIMKGRSHCDHCGHQLVWYELIPLVGYCMCKGRCRYCKQSLSYVYPLMEITGGTVACICFHHYYIHPYTFTSFLIAMILLVISIIDYRTMRIYDSCLLALACAGVLHWFVGGNVNLLEHLFSMAVISVPMYIITHYVKDAFGQGDVELMMITGLFLTPVHNILALMLGSLSAGIFCLYDLRHGGFSKGKHIPFVPYLSFGIVVSLLYGDSIVAWYIRMFY